MNEKPRILMCNPTHFGVTYTINPWMDPALWAQEADTLAAAAKREWRALRRTLEGLGAAVTLVPAQKGLPDLVFTANAAVVMNGTALLARFRHKERQAEEPVFHRAFDRLTQQGLIQEVRTLPEGVFLEGAGDCVFDATRAIYWMGHGPRSSLAAQPFVERHLGVATVPLALADPRFYHMDTALCPLAQGELIYVPCAFTAEGLAEIHARVAPELRLPVEPEDAERLAANAVNIGDTIVLSQCSDRFAARLAERGYRVRRTPLASFARSGGSAFCLTLRLDLATRGLPSQKARAEPAFAAVAAP